MEHSQAAGHDDRFVRRYEYDDHSLLAVDLPVGDEQVDVDVVGSTATRAPRSPASGPATPRTTGRGSSGSTAGSAKRRASASTTK